MCCYYGGREANSGSLRAAARGTRDIRENSDESRLGTHAPFGERRELARDMRGSPDDG